MSIQDLTVAKLRRLIGHEVQHRGCCCRIIEILEDGPHLILQKQGPDTCIQADQHGEAHRMVPTTFTLAVFDEDGFSNDFHQLGVSHLL